MDKLDQDTTIALLAEKEGRVLGEATLYRTHFGPTPADGEIEPFDQPAQSVDRRR